jgi:hypothetical protein
MDNFFSSLQHLEKGIEISIPTDENGLTDRECPSSNCLGYFKIKFGTGLKGENLPCHCPYCGHTAGHNHFWTQEQLEYTRSIMENVVSKALEVDVKLMDQKLRQSSKNSFIKLGLDFKSQAHPIQYYQEKQLETHVVCDNCTLEYAIYGVFAFCPDCGEHNSLQILSKNFEIVEKEITLAQSTCDSELAIYLIEDALENAVSVFDGFGRATAIAYSIKSSDIEATKKISFQNLEAATKKVNDLFGIEMSSVVNKSDWEFLVSCFQKRHLLAHTMGVIDEDYIKKAHDKHAIVGRKIEIVADDVLRLINLLEMVGNDLVINLK